MRAVFAALIVVLCVFCWHRGSVKCLRLRAVDYRGECIERVVLVTALFDAFDNEAIFTRRPTQSRRVTINLENGQVKTFWYAYVLDILLRLYTRTYPRKLEVK